MRSSAKLAALLATGALCIAACPAFAASATTEAFVANVRPNVEFLNKSSRLALDTSTNPRVKAFARRQATEQTITGNSLVAWSQVNTPAGQAVAIGEPASPVGDVVAAPLDAAAGVTTGIVDGVGDVATGRSVAIDQPAPLTVTRAPSGGSTLLPAQLDDMARLRGLSGREFDALYRATQSDALHQLATVYRSYIQYGDDMALRDIAVRELPKINARIAELPRT